MELAQVSFTSQSKINTIPLDVLESESPTYRNTVTQNPTEDGKKVSDNIIREPIELSLNCFISDFPIITGQTTDTSQGRRSLSSYFDLLVLRQNMTIFSIQTGLDLYENMAITNFKPTRNASNTNALEFQIDFQEVLKATAKEISVPREKIKSTPANAKDQAQSTVNKGAKQTNTADTKSGSLATELWDFVFK
jgi:hypothetical protein